MQWWALRYLLQKASDNIALLNSIDLIQRTAEMARVFGIDFASVITRGSQYRVESMLLRLTRAHAYALFSPSKEQVQQQVGKYVPSIIPHRSSGCKS